MTTPVVSTATIATDRAPRYGKQLVAHLGRRSVGVWDEEAASGTLDMSGGALVTLTSTPEALVITIACDPEKADLYEDVVGRHLVRFGVRDELVAAWTRADGTPGTTQAKTED